VNGSIAGRGGPTWEFKAFQVAGDSAHCLAVAGVKAIGFVARNMAAVLTDRERRKIYAQANSLSQNGYGAKGQKLLLLQFVFLLIL